MLLWIVWRIINDHIYLPLSNSIAARRFSYKSVFEFAQWVFGEFFLPPYDKVKMFIF